MLFIQNSNNSNSHRNISYLKKNRPDFYNDFIETLLYLFYDKKSQKKLEKYKIEKDYCLKNPSLKPLHAILQYLLVRQKRIQWLDIGCGDGRALCCLLNLENHLKFSSIDYLGIDSEKRHIYNAKNKWEKKIKLIKNVDINFKNFNIHEIEQIDDDGILNNKFDLISCINVLHEQHPHYNIMKTFKSIFSLINSNGLIFLFEPQYPLIKESNILTWKKEDIDLILEMFSFKGHIYSNRFLADYRDLYYFILEPPHEFINLKCVFCATRFLLYRKKDFLLKQKLKLEPEIESQTLGFTTGSNLSQISIEEIENNIFNYDLEVLMKCWKYCSNRHDIEEIEDILIDIEKIELENASSQIIKLLHEGIKIHSIKSEILKYHEPQMGELIEKIIQFLIWELEKEV